MWVEVELSWGWAWQKAISSNSIIGQYQTICRVATNNSLGARAPLGIAHVKKVANSNDLALSGLIKYSLNKNSYLY